MDFTKNKTAKKKRYCKQTQEIENFFYLDLFRAICFAALIYRLHEQQFCTSFALQNFVWCFISVHCWPWGYFVIAIVIILQTEYLNISRAPKPDCVQHMSADVCGCMCGLCRLLRRCINGTLGFSCHLCVYVRVCCQSVCFCACADLNHCSLYMLKKKKKTGSVARLYLANCTAIGVSVRPRRGWKQRDRDRRVSTTGSFSLIAGVVRNLQWNANQAFHMQY